MEATKQKLPEGPCEPIFIRHSDHIWRDWVSELRNNGAVSWHFLTESGLAKMLKLAEECQKARQRSLLPDALNRRESYWEWSGEWPTRIISSRFADIAREAAQLLFSGLGRTNWPEEYSKPFFNEVTVTEYGQGDDRAPQLKGACVGPTFVLVLAAGGEFYLKPAENARRVVPASEGWAIMIPACATDRFPTCYPHGVRGITGRRLTMTFRRRK